MPRGTQSWRTLSCSAAAVSNSLSVSVSFFLSSSSPLSGECKHQGGGQISAITTFSYSWYGVGAGSCTPRPISVQILMAQHFLDILKLLVFLFTINMSAMWDVPQSVWSISHATDGEQAFPYNDPSFSAGSKTYGWWCHPANWSVANCLSQNTVSEQLLPATITGNNFVLDIYGPQSINAETTMALSLVPASGQGFGEVSAKRLFQRACWGQAPEDKEWLIIQ